MYKMAEKFLFGERICETNVLYLIIHKVLNCHLIFCST